MGMGCGLEWRTYMRAGRADPGSEVPSDGRVSLLSCFHDNTVPPTVNGTTSGPRGAKDRQLAAGGVVSSELGEGGRNPAQPTSGGPPTGGPGSAEGRCPGRGGEKGGERGEGGEGGGTAGEGGGSTEHPTPSGRVRRIYRKSKSPFQVGTPWWRAARLCGAWRCPSPPRPSHCWCFLRAQRPDPQSS
jgi:hypothetical protein